MPQPLSYVIVSLTPPEINEMFYQAKMHFNNFFNNDSPTKPEHFILKNVAHVTLKRQFWLKDHIRDEEVRSALGSIRFQPIPIAADKIEVFKTEKHGNVLVILVDKTPELQKLHDELSSLIDQVATKQDTAFEKQDFTPHFSVFYNLPEEKIEEAKKYVKENITPISCTLNSFLFMRDVPGIVGEREKLKEYFVK